MKNNQKNQVVSFRDPGGSICMKNGRVIRIINKSGENDFKVFYNSRMYQKNVEKGRIVYTSFLDKPEIVALNMEDIITSDTALVVEHERIPFPSYPYEWPVEMLYSAGRLTLELAMDSLETGIGIKDGTPYNVLFKGFQPVFIDILSFEQRDPNDYVWLPYAQFMRTFMLPLLANKYFNLSLTDIFLNRRDGLEPEEVYQLCSQLQKLGSPFLSLVSLPTWLARKHNQDDITIYQKKTFTDPEKAKFILESTLRRLKKGLNKLKPETNQKSTWSDYFIANNNYSREQQVIKSDFVKEVLNEFKPKNVLDVGCNTGYFSIEAAKNGAGVVALDYDPIVVGKLWQEANNAKLDILPLVVNLTRPTPATGWRNQECLSFLERARGAFDMIFMLAVVHHMLVSERIPLPEIIALLAEITTDLLIIEYVDPSDSMFRRLSRGRDHLYSYYNQEYFETVCNRYFSIARKRHIEDSKRWLYLLRKKES